MALPTAAYVVVALAGLSKSAVVADTGTAFGNLTPAAPVYRVTDSLSGHLTRTWHLQLTRNHGWVEVALTGLSKYAVIPDTSGVDWASGGQATVSWTGYVLRWYADGTSECDFATEPIVYAIEWQPGGTSTCTWNTDWPWSCDGAATCEFDGSSAGVVTAFRVVWYSDGAGSFLIYKRLNPIDPGDLGGDGEWTDTGSGGGTILNLVF